MGWSKNKPIRFSHARYHFYDKVRDGGWIVVYLVLCTVCKQKVGMRIKEKKIKSKIIKIFKFYRDQDTYSCFRLWIGGVKMTHSSIEDDSVCLSISYVFSYRRCSSYHDSRLVSSRQAWKVVDGLEHWLSCLDVLRSEYIEQHTLACRSC